MSVYGNPQDATISAGNLETSAIDLGREYEDLCLTIPAMGLCKLSLKVSTQLSGMYYALEDATTNEETFNRAAIWKLGGWRFIKIVASNTQPANRVIKVFGSRP